MWICKTFNFLLNQGSLDRPPKSSLISLVLKNKFNTFIYVSNFVLSSEMQQWL